MRVAAALGALLAIGIGSASTAAAGPALLFEAQSGRVLYAEDLDDQWHPASLTKIMTAYVVFQAIKAGQIKLDTRIPVSEAANAQPPSKIGLPVGADMAVDLALQALVIKSANDVAVMLAEAVGGTEAAFVERMNRTAAALGMSRTNFVNPNGLPAPEQVTTARDLARLSRAVLQDFPEYAHLWSQPEMRVGKIRIHTHNGLLRTYEGADGLKTGFICDSGYNVVASATRDGTRMVAVVLGEASGFARGMRAQMMLDHAFNTSAWKAYFKAPTLDTLPAAPEARSALSIRQTVMATECGFRRARAVAAAKVKKIKAATAEGSTGEAKNAAPKAKPSPKPAAAPKQADAAGSEKAVQQKPKPKAQTAQQ